jgi:hypothetical protein
MIGEKLVSSSLGLSRCYQEVLLRELTLLEPYNDPLVLFAIRHWIFDIVFIGTI